MAECHPSWNGDSLLPNFFSPLQNCWNCGRRATETCSGCNKARYCGTFCQHKDWANHMHHCASGIQSQWSVVATVQERGKGAS